MGNSKSTRWFWLSLLIVAADRATKLAIEAYTPKSFRRVLIPDVVTLVHSHNPGIAFGLFADVGSKWFITLLIAGSAGVILLLAWLLATGRVGSRTTAAGLALILGGAAGNLIDRLMHGSVTDFFEVRLGSYHWPAFNLADSAITIGAVLAVLELLFARRHPNSQKV